MTPEQKEKLERLRTWSNKDLLSMDQVDWLIKLVDELHGTIIQLKCELNDALMPCKYCACDPCDCDPNTPRR